MNEPDTWDLNWDEEVEVHVIVYYRPSSKKDLYAFWKKINEAGGSVWDTERL